MKTMTETDQKNVVSEVIKLDDLHQLKIMMLFTDLAELGNSQDVLERGRKLYSEDSFSQRLGAIVNKRRAIFNYIKKYFPSVWSVFPEATKNPKNSGCQ